MPVSDCKCTSGANVSQRAAAHICYFKTLIKENIAFHLPRVIYVTWYKTGAGKLIAVFWIVQSIGIGDHKWVPLQRKGGNTTEQRPFSEPFRFKYPSRSSTSEWDVFLFICLVTGTSCVACCSRRPKQEEALCLTSGGCCGGEIQFPRTVDAGVPVWAD